jgi:hypothetical protein
MKRKRIIAIIVLLCFVGLIGYGYVRLNYYHGWKKIDIRKTWPKGQWLGVQFVERDFGEEWLALEVPQDKLDEFQQQLKQEIRNAQKCCVEWWYYIVLQPDQLRITTTKGKYYVPIIRGLAGIESIYGRTWQSDTMRKWLCDWGYKQPDPCLPALNISCPDSGGDKP